MILNTGDRCGALMSPFAFLQQFRLTEDKHHLGFVAQQELSGSSSPDNIHDSVHRTRLSVFSR